MTASILYFNYRTQQIQADLKREESLFTALHDAADSTKAADIRISGLWALSKFWEPEYETIVANTLGAVLVTDGPEPVQRIRLNAAEVVGTAISGIPGSPSDWSRSDRDRTQR